ncbi:MAG TPA: hypothetical protein VIN59_06760, partial [Alphaproteobacteria bacterium]
MLRKYIALFLVASFTLTASQAHADCAAAPIATATDMVISMKTANGVQVAPANKLSSSVKEGMVVYDDTANSLKLCDGTNWVSVGSGGGSTASGGAGYIQFSDGTNLANSGTTAGQQFFWDNTNKRLGIGTASPAHPLVLGGTSVVTQAQVGGNSAVYLMRSNPAIGFNTYWDGTQHVYGAGSSNVYGGRIGFDPATGKMSFATTAATGNAAAAAAISTRMTIDKDGNVGINTVSPVNALDVNAIAVRFGQLGFLTNFPEIMFNGYYDGAKKYTYGASSFNIYHSQSTDLLTIGYAPDGVAGDPVAYSPALSVSSTGNVLVGNSTLDASSKLQINSTTQGFLPPRMTTAQRTAISSPATGLVVYDTDLNSLYIKTASAWAAVGSGGGGAGNGLGVLGYAVRNDTGSVTITGTIPADNTIPQVSEGSEILSVSVTVPDESDYLYFNIDGLQYTESSNHSDIFTVALFRDGQSGTDALAAYAEEGDYANNEGSINTTLRVVAPVAGTYTYRIRAGLNNGSAYLNRGYNGVQVTLAGNINQASVTVLADKMGGGGGGSSTLAGLTDVDVTTPPTNGQSLVYDTTSSKWKPGTVSGGGGTQVAFHAHRNNVDQSVTPTTYTLVDLTTESYDTNNNFNPATDRFTPTVAGKYLIGGNVYCAGGGTTGCEIYIYKNGSTIIADTAVSTGGIVPVVTIVDMSGSTDYVQLYARNTGGSLFGGGGTYATSFYGSLLGGGGGGTPSGTAGYVQFSNGSAFANSGTTAGQQFFWDDTNKRLGVGTA